MRDNQIILPHDLSVKPRYLTKSKQKKAPRPERFLSVHSPTIATEWHPTKNGLVTPSQVTYGSAFIAWWQCSHGHVWQAPIHRRTVKFSGCPYCTGKKIQIGFNDLLTIHPHIAKEWHPTKNIPLLPTEVTSNSNKRIWWQCKKGHEWQTSISNRTITYSQCPHCYREELKEKKRKKPNG